MMRSIHVLRLSRPRVQVDAVHRNLVNASRSWATDRPLNGVSRLAVIPINTMGKRCGADFCDRNKNGDESSGIFARLSLIIKHTHFS